MTKLTQEQLLFAKGIGATHCFFGGIFRIEHDNTIKIYINNQWGNVTEYNHLLVNEEKYKIDFSPLDKKEDEPQKPKHNKYMREIKPGVWVDIYDVLQAWKITNPAQQHLAKKALQGGQRGHKNYETDMRDIIASATRAIELERATQELEK